MRLGKVMLRIVRVAEDWVDGVICSTLGFVRYSLTGRKSLFWCEVGDAIFGSGAEVGVCGG